MNTKSWTAVSVVCGVAIVGIGVFLVGTDIGRYVLAMFGGSIQAGHL